MQDKIRSIPHQKSPAAQVTLSLLFCFSMPHMMAAMETNANSTDQSLPPTSAAGQGDNGIFARVNALRPGTWPAAPEDLTITAQDIRAIVEAYNPTTYQAPVVIGHPATDDPAWGWVESAEVDDSGLWLNLSLLPEMADLIRDGRYKTVSVSLWRPGASGNPAPGVWSLRHLGYLGAVPPAVKGLSKTILANQSEGEVVNLSFSENNTGEIAMEEGKAKDSVALAERESVLAEREAALASREREMRREGYSREIDAIISAGKILPAEKPALIALMERLEGGDAVTLADAGTSVAPQQLLRDFLNRIPSRVTLGELAGPDKTVLTAAPMPSIPSGYTLSERGEQMHRAAVTIQKQNGCTYAEAVRIAERAQGDRHAI